MINYLRRRLSEGRVGIIAESHDTGVRDLLREEIFQPKGLRLRMCPGVDGIAAEAVDGHNTEGRLRSAKLLNKDRSQPVGLSEGLTL